MEIRWRRSRLILSGISENFTADTEQNVICVQIECICAPPKQGIYWGIHLQRSDVSLDLTFSRGETSRVLVEYGHAHLINPSLGMYQEIPPSRPISMDNMFQAYCCSLVLFNKYACAVFAFYAKYEFVCVLFPWFGLF